MLSQPQLSALVSPAHRISLLSVPVRLLVFITLRAALSVN
ncbi:Uncharacterised protein [Vibrio cholerae]|nr:Uncharacterised protein [Vibrio cholerae]